MVYLTENDFLDMGFEEVDDYDKLAQRAQLAIDLFIGHFYDRVDFEGDVAFRKKAVKLAMAFQIAYLDSSGILSAEDRQALASLTVGRTSVSLSGGSGSSLVAQGYNLSQDCFNALKSAGFSYAGVLYDR